jgi:ATP-binding cassette, subfamily B, heavy metal transporter
MSTTPNASQSATVDANTSEANAAAPSPSLRAVKMLLPYLWRYRGRVALIIISLSIAKVANLGIPITFKHIIDALDPKLAPLAVPAALLLAYGALRLSSTLFNEVRGLLFAVVSTRARREAARTTFEHLHRLSLKFHLERKTGGLSRSVERGTGAIEDFLYYSTVSIIPIVLEVSLALGWLFWFYPAKFALLTLATLFMYVFVTLKITDWRTRYYRAGNEADQEANSLAVDSLLNFETVKYFNNETFESDRYDQALAKYEQAARKSWLTLTALNAAQAATIALGLTVLMWLAATEVTAGRMSLGDLVLVNTMLLQLYTPLSFLGMMYRDVKQALTDMEKMFGLLDVSVDIADKADAQILQTLSPGITFDAVSFGYDARRKILNNLSFSVPAGKNVAVVGPSGAGKSTLARLLYRFYDVDSGAIRVANHDLRDLTQLSLRQAIGIVPQDTVLFNDSIYYNIAYGRPNASKDEVIAAAKAAQIHDFVSALPDGYESAVGERGLKLSGGEKQRVAIARAILKAPPILIFDEATSALDSTTERAIQAQLDAIAQGRTTLTVAHRLSTVVNADQILVLVGGEIAESGTHSELLAKAGEYARMWALQQREDEASIVLS